MKNELQASRPGVCFVEIAEASRGAHLLGAGVKLYVLPQPVQDVRAVLDALEGGAELWSSPDEGIATLENTEPTTRLRHLYRYMRETGTLVTVEAV